MAITYTFTQTGNKVIVDEVGGSGGARKFTYKADYNVMPSRKPLHILITDDVNSAGLNSQSYEYDISNITGNPTPADVNATVAWLTTNFFKGLTIADLSVDEINVDIVRSNLETIKNESDDMVKTFTYYVAIVAGENPSGNKNVSTIVYSSTALALSATEKFKYDALDDVITIDLLP